MHIKRKIYVILGGLLILPLLSGCGQASTKSPTQPSSNAHPAPNPQPVPTPLQPTNTISYKQSTYDLNVGQPASIQAPSFTGGIPTKFKIDQSTPLPAGLNLDSNTGMISGTPIAESPSSILIKIFAGNDLNQDNFAPTSIVISILPFVGPNITIDSFSLKLNQTATSTIRNLNKAGNITINTITLKDTSGEFILSNDSCSNTILTPAGSCKVMIKYMNGTQEDKTILSVPYIDANGQIGTDNRNKIYGNTPQTLKVSFTLGKSGTTYTNSSDKANIGFYDDESDSQPTFNYGYFTLANTSADTIKLVESITIIEKQLNSANSFNVHLENCTIKQFNPGSSCTIPVQFKNANDKHILASDPNADLTHGIQLQFTTYDQTYGNQGTRTNSSPSVEGTDTMWQCPDPSELADLTDSTKLNPSLKIHWQIDNTANWDNTPTDGVPNFPSSLPGTYYLWNAFVNHYNYDGRVQCQYNNDEHNFFLISRSTQFNTVAGHLWWYYNACGPLARPPSQGPSTPLYCKFFYNNDGKPLKSLTDQDYVALSQQN